MAPWSFPVKTEQRPPTLPGKLLTKESSVLPLGSQGYKLITTFLAVPTGYPTKATLKKNGLFWLTSVLEKKLHEAAGYTANGLTEELRSWRSRRVYTLLTVHANPHKEVASNANTFEDPYTGQHSVCV